jgi:hypothetical protein
MRVEIHRCPTCPLLQAHAAGLASALKAELNAEVVILAGKPSEFNVTANGEALVDWTDGLPSIHQILNAARKLVRTNGLKSISRKAKACQSRRASRSCRLPGVYHYAGHECVSGINLLPPAWFQTRVISPAAVQIPPERSTILVGEPFAAGEHPGYSAIDVAQPVGEAVTW